MSELRLRLTKGQLSFLSKMLEIQDPQAAAKRFAEIMLEEKFNPNDMPKVLEICMSSWSKKK